LKVINANKKNKKVKEVLGGKNKKVERRCEEKRQ
jgi:hypothetical protein